MTDFSQSLLMGDNTLEALEKQLDKPYTPPSASTLRASISRRNKALNPSSSTEDVIEESPTNVKCTAESSRHRSVRARFQTFPNHSKKNKNRTRSCRGIEPQKLCTPDRKPNKKFTSDSLLKKDSINEAHFDSSVFQDYIKENRDNVDQKQERQKGGVKRPASPNGNGDGCTLEKQMSLRRSDEFDEIFQNSNFSLSHFSEKTKPSSQNVLKDDNYQTLFDQSDFTLNAANGTASNVQLPKQTQQAIPVATESELEIFSETLFDRAISSEPLLDDLLEASSLLAESLRVEDSVNETVEDFPLDIENVTFSQPLVPANIVLKNDAHDELQEQAEKTALHEFVESEIASFLHLSNESLMPHNVDSAHDSGLLTTSLGHKPSEVNKLIEAGECERRFPPLGMSLDQSKDLRLLSNWGLPSSVAKEYTKKGIVELFPWQVECLSRREVLLEGKNLVYSAPTSAGKTLVSEFLLAKTIAERKLKALLILPFVAVAREKMLYLRDLLAPGGMRVEGFYGGYHPPGGFESVDLAVCTIEKANSIVNRLLEQSTLDTLGLVVVDEVHLISDPARGYILELLLTKIRYVSARSGHRIQIICMSATLPNIELLARWLDADLFCTDFRPIALKEMMKIGSTIYGATGEPIRFLKGTLLGYSIPKDPDHVALLCVETVLEKCSAIVFCPSKDWCEQLAITLASTLHSMLKENHPHGALRERLRDQVDSERQQEVLLQLRNCPAGLDNVLAKTIRYGVAFHHAGLTTDERDIVESSFRDGTLRIIVATSTLSSGVNLPARRVIVRTPKFGGRPMSSLTYRQMIGRAGRTGQDTLGESVLICSPAEEKIGRELIGAELPSLNSCLDSEHYTHLKRAVLEIIASGSASTAQELESFVNATLYSCEKSYRFHIDDKLLLTKPIQAQQVISEVNVDEATDRGDSDPIAACISFLLEYEFIRVHQSDVKADDGTAPTGKLTVLTATRLGHACLAASLPPKDGFLLFSELQRARQCFVLESELHAVYLVTPYSVAYQWQQIDWMDFLDMWEKLPEASKRVGELVGVKESFLVRAMRGASNLDYRALQVHKRFYTALALLELVREVPLCDVARTFKCCRGLLQSLQQISSTFAGIVATFCASLNWTLLRLIVAQFRERLFFGVAHELLDLMRIPSLNGQRARLLYDGGITGLVQLANADRLAVENILHNRASFEAERAREDENEYEAARRKRLRNLYLTGRAGVTVEEAAKLIVQEARTFLQLEHGLANPNWSETISVERKTEEGVPVEGTTNVADASESLSSSNAPMEQSSGRLGASINSSNGLVTNFHNSLLMAGNRRDNPEQERNDSTSRITIIDACENATTFDQFRQLMADQDSITISFGVEQDDLSSLSEFQIGGHLQSGHPPSETRSLKRRRLYTFQESLYLAGLAIAIPSSTSTAYYVDLQNETSVDGTEKERFVRWLFGKEQLTITLLDAKDQLKIIYRAGLIPVAESDSMLMASVQDPRVACWLLQAEPETLTMEAMIERHCPALKQAECAWTGQRWHTPKWTGHGLNYRSPIEAKQRCTVECLLVSQLMTHVHQRLEASGNSLPVCFRSREMPVQLALARSEVVGFPVHRDRLEALIVRLKTCRDRIADEARKLNGNRRLDFGSSRAVAAALRLTDGNRKHCRTARQVLERLESPLAALVIAHRKIESNLARTIEPLYRTIRPGDNRAHGRSFCFTATGRITMHEPNLQTIVKDFSVPLGLGFETDDERVFSCRSTFACADPETVLLSADFCQLELCILTHLSQDRRLLAALGGDGYARDHRDIFRVLAARWNQLDRESDVSEDLRNRTKVVVYGVIYGMGTRTMADELQLDEDAARTLMEQFHASYPDIRRYTEHVIRLTRQLGYIETLTGRRRYLPAIFSDDTRKRAEAERQAVCTTIQGSAADILKNAIARMRRNLLKYRDILELGAIRLVLHLHDELIYEVPRAQLSKVAKILQSSMENCAKLSVPLRVKLKAGASWGSMQELSCG
ncbi:DNA polymerase theta [Anopheles nili]|uniref:DNA polymerase theta n=1 Tax=Anopheles nili TaxID=185578 RepID=UPI00237BE51B|nr:DNA polymerase theta [Anopheles nili]